MIKSNLRNYHKSQPFSKDSNSKRIYWSRIRTCKETIQFKLSQEVKTAQFQGQRFSMGAIRIGARIRTFERSFERKRDLCLPGPNGIVGNKRKLLNHLPQIHIHKKFMTTNLITLICQHPSLKIHSMTRNSNSLKICLTT